MDPKTIFTLALQLDILEILHKCKMDPNYDELVCKNPEFWGRRMEIEKLVSQPESKTLEFKRDVSSLNPILKTVVAFANTAGGKIVIGIGSDGELLGLENSTNTSLVVAESGATSGVTITPLFFE